MPWIAAAVGAGGALLGGLIGGDSQRSASNKATDAQSRAAADANALQKYMYDQTRQDAQPYRDIGYGALDQLSVLLGLSGGQGSVKPRQRTEDELRAALAPRYAGDAEGLNAAVQSWQQREQAKVDAWRQGNGQDTGGLKDPNFGLLTKKFEDQGPFTGKDLQNDAGYQFRLQQGQDALENSRAAMGGLFSGATGKALSEYGQGFASNEFQNAYNRYTNDQNIAYNRYNNDQSNLFNRLSGLAGTGQTANQQVQGAGMNYANQVGGNLIGMGNAQAANQLAQGNIRGNMFNQGFAALSRMPFGQSSQVNMPDPFSGSGTGYGIGGGDGFYTNPYGGE